MIDYTNSLPDECLALIFNFLTTTNDRNNSSLVSHRWLRIDAQTRRQLTLNAQSNIQPFIRSIFTRFNSLTQLVLHCPKSSSINNHGLMLITHRCPNLTCLKLRACPGITYQGMVILSHNCRKLKKFSCSECNFGAKGIIALLNTRSCSSLEELSVRYSDSEQLFEPLIIGSNNLKTLKFKLLSGEWDRCLEMIAVSGNCLVEVHLEHVDISDNGLFALSKCSNLQVLHLEELSVKFLDTGRQLSEPLSIGSNNLKTLKLIALLGDWDRFLEMIVVSGNSLVEVHLGHVDVTDIGRFALSKFSNLQVLHLDGVWYRSNAGLINVVEHCKNLKKLYIDNRLRNVIRNEDLIAIAKYCLNLEELVLIGVDACCISLEEIAVNCRKLERLDLCSSETITDVEISYISEKCVALKKLLIRECCVSDKGVEAFALGCPNLVEFRITKCENVTHDVKDRLRARRRSLVVKLDVIKSKTVNAIIVDSGVQEHVAEIPLAADHVAVTEP